MKRASVVRGLRREHNGQVAHEKRDRILTFVFWVMRKFYSALMGETMSGITITESWSQRRKSVNVYRIGWIRKTSFN